MPIFRKIQSFLLLALLLITLQIGGCNGHKEIHPLTITGRTMGTTYLVKIVQSPPLVDLETIEKEISTLLEKINQQMSTYQSGSELSRFNSFRKTDWFPVAPDIITVVKAAFNLSKESTGAFDITIGPLVNLWGFGPETINGVKPTSEAISQRKKLVGYEKLHFRESPAALRKETPELYCDLSAIAKGFGVDAIGHYLEEKGIHHYMVEIGGEVRTSGSRQDKQPWRIGLQAPDEGKVLQKIVALHDLAMATSGDYANYREIDGIRFSHTIDPRNGRPISHNLASVTVLHPSCMMADGLATLINVLGPKEGLAFAQNRKLPVFFIIRTDEGFIEQMTPEFRPFLTDQL